MLRNMGYACLSVQLQSLQQWNSQIMSWVTQNVRQCTFVFYYFGHGGLSNNVPVFQATSGNLVPLDHLYVHLNQNNTGQESNNVFIFETCATQVNMNVNTVPPPKKTLILNSTLPNTP